VGGEPAAGDVLAVEQLLRLTERRLSVGKIPAMAKREKLTQVEPGDVVSFTAETGERVTGRAWPITAPLRLHLEVKDGRRFFELPPFEELTVRRARSRQRLPFAQNLNDFRPGLDVVVRFMGRHFAGRRERLEALLATGQVALRFDAVA
jgi:hypothetical protein